MADAAPSMNARPRARRGLLVAGFAAVALAAIGIAYFVVRSAIAGFPSETITAGRNWIFIGCHAFLGIVGLVLLAFFRQR